MTNKYKDYIQGLARKKSLANRISFNAEYTNRFSDASLRIHNRNGGWSGDPDFRGEALFQDDRAYLEAKSLYEKIEELDAALLDANIDASFAGEEKYGDIARQGHPAVESMLVKSLGMNVMNVISSFYFRVLTEKDYQNLLSGKVMYKGRDLGEEFTSFLQKHGDVLRRYRELDSE